ncbi:MAG: hypothetical protein AMS16_01245 [Planctomycetes bacterium DG_58]|nr:MAG: hypothetical protein AMS16_01245 [Planctomycetes bacterium DG_58]
MRTRRFLWVAIFALGAGVAALMAASVMLHRAVGVAGPGDLKTPVMGLRQAMTEWNWEKLTTYTSDIPRETYQQMFDDANAGDPARASKLKGVLSAMDTFPSIRFPNIEPERVDVNYEVADGTSAAMATVSFVPREQGYFLRVVRFPVISTEKRPDATIVFREGDNVALDDALEKLFDTLTRGTLDEFRALMMLGDDLSRKDVMARLDETRALVMTYRDSRLRKMIPKVGPLPHGTKWFRVLVVGEVDDKNLWLDMTVVPGDPVRFRSFKAGRMKERQSPTKQPPTPPAEPPPGPPAEPPAKPPAA